MRRNEMLVSPLAGLVAVQVFLLAAVASAAPVETKGKIESVTLYRGEALVTRIVALDAAPGQVELVVTDLPERMEPESLYASAEKGAQVRAVRYRSRNIGVAPRAEVMKLDEQIETVTKAVRENELNVRRLKEQRDYLTKLQNFVAPTAQVELTRGVLDSDKLKALTLFMFDQMKSFAGEELAQSAKRDELSKQQRQLESQRATLTTSYAKLAREAVVFLEKTEPGAAQVRLSYVVSGSSWSPAYNLRASGEMKEIKAEYNSIIQQMSGEDWDAVALTLSTASPNIGAEPPVLAPFLVQLSPGEGGVALGWGSESGTSGATGYASSHRRMRELDQSRSAQTTRSALAASNWGINVESQKKQGAELYASEQVARALREAGAEEGSALSVNYKLTGPVSLASRADQQIVRIADLTLAAQFCNIAIPLLTERVYRQAEITNNSNIALLEGICSCYLNSEFVGKGMLPVVATGQHFKAGFGSDPQLRAWREFVSRQEATQGGNKEVTLQYRLVLDNYKDTPVTVRAFDRLPHGGNELRVTLSETKDKLSTDAEYLRAFRPSGILRWDVEVPAKSAATTARIVDYGYKLEFDKNMNVEPASEDDMQKGKAMMEMQMESQ